MFVGPAPNPNAHEGPRPGRGTVEGLHGCHLVALMLPPPYSIEAHSGIEKVTA